MGTVLIILGGIILLWLGFVLGLCVGVQLCVKQEKRDGVYEMHHEIIRNKYGRDM